MRRTTGRAARAALAILMAVGASGCGYSLRPPYDPKVRTIYVPIFRTVSTFRRDINFQLTNQIIYEIERRTPYKVVGSPEGADAVLEGTIDIADKNIFLENPNNMPRQLVAMLTVSARVYDNRVPDQKIDVPFTNFSETVNFYPELGETASLGFQKAINNIAAQIVGAMEVPWQTKPAPVSRPR